MPLQQSSARTHNFTFLASAEDIYLRFEAGGERYALPISETSEICEPEALRPVPGAFFPIAGVMDLRGRIVTLMDMFGALAYGNTPGKIPQAVVLHEPYHHVGILVPGMVDTFTLNDGEAARPADDEARARRPWAADMLEHRGRLYNVISGERLCAFARARLIQTFKQ